MISLIEALNYRCLRYVRQPLGPFQVLVGPNASGKTTFLDVVAFLGKMVSDGLEEAISERTQNFKDLVWQRTGTSFELAIEAALPSERRMLLGDRSFDTIRYEVKIGMESNGEVAILSEKVYLKDFYAVIPQLRFSFPFLENLPNTILSGVTHTKNDKQIIISKSPQGNDNYYSEVFDVPGKQWAYRFKLGTRKSALGNLPEDETRFPATTWLKSLLSEGVQQFVLNSLLIRRPSPPLRIQGFKPDGSNLPWVIERLRKNSPERFREWISHVQTALPDIEDIDTIERPEDRNRYLIVSYKGGVRVPSWVVSDGTLRLLALTIPAYLPDFEGVYLIEEPENGIHPRAVETVIQSLLSTYDAQILLATHSTVILNIVKPEDILCFAKTADGATDIVRGSNHPELRDWQGETNLGILFAAGVLG